MSFFKKGSEKNWEHLKKEDVGDKARYRDVYARQNLERGKKPQKVSIIGYIILELVFAIFFAVMLYTIVSFFFSHFTGKKASNVDTGIVTESEVATNETAAEEVPTNYVSATALPVYDEYERDELDKLSKYDFTDGNIMYQWIFANISEDGIHCEYWAINQDGTRIPGVYSKPGDVPMPDWVKPAWDKHVKDSGGKQDSDSGSSDGELEVPAKRPLGLDKPTPEKILIVIFLDAIIMGVIHVFIMRVYKTQNLMADTTQINTYDNDRHIQVPEEIQKAYDWFPDAGAISSVSPNSMISHMMVKNKGIKPVYLAKRYDDDVIVDGIEHFKGEYIVDSDGNAIFEKKPMFDEKFADKIYDAMEIPEDKNFRRWFTVDKVPYNLKNKNYDKLKNFNMVSDLINGDWELSYYEPQRPAGAYIVDTAPVNTILVAITRAGKGQGYIEAMVDMWTRERHKNNYLCNDPKGELLLKFYARNVVRGFEVIQFNLINPMKTMIYNPLGLAASSAREGDFTKCATYVTNIAEVFFPVEGADDPLWPNAANNAFRRAAYGLIDYYLEEEKALRIQGYREGWNVKVLNYKIDMLWAKVSLYNCYQFFVRLSSKKMQNPLNAFAKRYENGDFDDLSEEEVDAKKEQATKEAELFDGKPELDLLTLYFNACAKLPANGIRGLMADADGSLRAIGGAEKMLSSVYGIAITAMNFFTDPTISTLTSGPLSQNIDLAGVAFPRRFGVRFDSDYMAKYHLKGMECRFTCYRDDMFTNAYGKEFKHSDIVDMVGWAKCAIEGIFEDEIAYIKMELYDQSSEMLLNTYYFRFTRSYLTTADGGQYKIEPVTQERCVRDGILEELQPVCSKDGTIEKFVLGRSTFKAERIVNILTCPESVDVERPVFRMEMAKYSEKPKAMFVVTPPNRMPYAKIILILLKQLVDLNFEGSYMTKKSQKPILKTRYMLDELGNLQCDGHGIKNFEVLLSIGLGQEQLFTLVLQTFQQLSAVYGDKVNEIIEGNVNNVVFLKSTNGELIEKLSKKSGVTHIVETNRNVTNNINQVAFGNDSKITLGQSVKEVPVLTYNDLAYMPPSSSVVFRSGDDVIWNRNETALPPSRILHKNTICNPGHEYTLQNIPSMSNAMSFDVRTNMPDFMKMLKKRMDMAIVAQDAIKFYNEAYEYTEYDVARQDPDVYSDGIMELIAEMVEEYQTFGNTPDYDEADPLEGYDVSRNDEVIKSQKEMQAEYEQANIKRYAGNQISRIDLGGIGKNPNHYYDEMFAKAYMACKQQLFQDKRFEAIGDGGLRLKETGETLINVAFTKEQQDAINEAIADDNSRVYAEEDVVMDQSVSISDAFYRFLWSLDSWNDLGNFDREMARLVHDAVVA